MGLSRMLSRCDRKLQGNAFAWNAFVMTLMESPVRLVMAGSWHPHEPAITKRTGDSMSVMTNQAFLKRFPGISGVFTPKMRKTRCGNTQCYGRLHYFCILQSQCSTFWRVFLSLACVFESKNAKMLQLYQGCTIIIILTLSLLIRCTREYFHIFVRSFTLVWQ